MSRAVLFRDRRLLTFAVCLFLFQVANASMLPILGERLVHAEGHRSALVVSALIVVPQIIVALLAPWAGRTADTWGRRPLLLLGLGVVPIRAGVFALTADPALLVLVQALDGLTGAVLGVLTALVIADLAKGTGRFNLAQGLVGTLSGVGASLSTSISGLVVERFGNMTGFLSVTTVGLMAVTILWAFMPETKSSALQSQLQNPGPGAGPRLAMDAHGHHQHLVTYLRSLAPSAPAQRLLSGAARTDRRQLVEHHQPPEWLDLDNNQARSASGRRDEQL